MVGRLSCDRRGPSLEIRGTISNGKTVLLHQCSHFNAPCSTALPTIEGHRCCKVCPAKTSSYRHHAQHAAQTGIAVRVVRQGCRTKCRWAWVVLLDGVVKASGNEETEEAARAEAESEARALEELS